MNRDHHENDFMIYNPKVCQIWMVQALRGKDLRPEGA